MTNLVDINRNTRSAGITVWLALAAVLLLQFESVAHEAQHSLSDLGDVCEICIQLHGGVTTDSGATVAALPLAPPVRIDAWIDAPVVVSGYCTPRLRAPPASI